MPDNKHGSVRRYVLSISPDALRDDPELLPLIKKSGVDEVAITGFLYGYWHYSIETIEHWFHEAHAIGLKTSIINVPLGHPGDSLGAKSGDVPLGPPSHWSMYTTIDGTKLSGTSIHAPATEENCAAVKKLLPLKPTAIWVDDDFRLARTPGMIGGCFCPEHKLMFLHKYGYSDRQWGELLDAINSRRLCPIVQQWVDMQCDLLTECFNSQQKAAGRIPMGNMIMYLGSEKAGIRLKAYANSPFRVGESQFNDASMGSLKGKTDELYSVLFHRRYAKPQLAYSETTAFPADQLSASNMAAKLCISTIADVRNTMFMSGVSAFPKTHWQTLAPAMKQQADIHAQIAGAKLYGPLKHYFGTGSRYVGDDNPFSMFLAMGIPFEVCERAPIGGYCFLGNSDVPQANDISAKGSTLICRPEASAQSGCRAVREDFADLMSLKHEIIGKMGKVPYVLQDEPVVCAWYPSIRKVLLWSLSTNAVDLTVVYGSSRRNVRVDALGTALVDCV